MWVNPKYRDQVEQPRPPQETGRRLATFPRGDGVELRVSLAEYQGRPYVALRVWERGQDGQWWPVRGKGCSVRVAEARELAEALLAVASGQGATTARDTDHSSRDDRPKFVEKGRAARPPWDAASMPKLEGPTGGGGEFSEF